MLLKVHPRPRPSVVAKIINIARINKALAQKNKTICVKQGICGNLW